MIVDRYYYQQLNEQEKAVYKAFYNGVMAQQDIIPIPIRGTMPHEVMDRIFMAITRDNPLIYFLNQSACSFATDMSGNVAICPQYFYTVERIKEYNLRIEETVNEIAEQLELNVGSDYEKELKVHDWLCRNVTYDFGGSDVTNPAKMISAHNIIGVFANYKAQCEGIAKAAKVLLNAVDVKCIVVTGNADENGKSGTHAWNLVKIGDVPYHFDVTWDIGVAGESLTYVPYDYFNITDEEIQKTHMADANLPKCTETADNYFVRNQICFKTGREVFAYIECQAAKGVANYYFKYIGKGKISRLKKEIEDIVIRESGKNENCTVGLRTMINDNLGVCRIAVS